jgi:REP element-mobilizing transposase RayT
MGDAGRQPGKGHAALRRGRASLAGQVYLVTFTTQGRRRVFAEPASAMAAARAVIDPRLWQDAQLLAWVLMPDHWHGLVRLGGTQDLSRLIRRLKANTARALTGHTAPVWARAFHDRALRDEDDLVAGARYLVMNPVRAGLVERVGDYPYWNAVWL